jgi:hypothetical protein
MWWDKIKPGLSVHIGEHGLRDASGTLPDSHARVTFLDPIVDRIEQLKRSHPQFFDGHEEVEF